jgi:hypothetical protein
MSIILMPLKEGSHVGMRLSEGIAYASFFVTLKRQAVRFLHLFIVFRKPTPVVTVPEKGNLKNFVFLITPCRAKSN